MSLLLSCSKPAGVEAKTYGYFPAIKEKNAVHLNLPANEDQGGGEIEIDARDFCQLALYFLTNSDLVPNDPRLGFLKSVASLHETKGFRAGDKRLDFRRAKKRK